MEIVDVLGYRLLSGQPGNVVNHLFSLNESKVFFLNANLYNELYSNHSDRNRVKCNTVFLNDGIGIDLAQKMLGKNSFEYNLNGTDFLPLVLKHCEVQGLVCGFFGAKPDVLEKFIAKISLNFPELKVGFAIDGYRSDGMARVDESLSRGGCQVVFVAMGNPKQELLISSMSKKHNVEKWFGVGAFFDFYSGTIARAPKLFRKARLEWLYRLILEPKRLFVRYIIGNPLFLVRVLIESKRSDNK